MARAPSMVAMRRTASAGSTVGSHPAHLVQLGREIHGREEVEVVVAGGPVGPQADADPGGQQRGHRRDAGGELQVALRAVRHAGAARGDPRDVRLVQPDRMHEQGAFVQETGRVEQAHGRGPVRGADALDLRAGLGRVDLEQQAELAADALGADERLRRAGQGRVAEDGGRGSEGGARARRGRTAARPRGCRRGPGPPAPGGRSPPGRGPRAARRLPPPRPPRPRGSSRPRRWSSRTGASPRRRAVRRCGRSRGSGPRPRPGRCAPAASARAAGRPPGRGRASWADGCGC